MAYDPYTGATVSQTISGVGTFTGTYDAGGTLTGQTYPGGLTASYTHDEAGNPTSLVYGRPGDPQPWLVFTNSSDRNGQVRTASSPASSQLYGYDTAGRLTDTRDTVTDPAGQNPASCTDRAYTFNANSDRTGLTSTIGSPADGGGCDLTGATPTLTHPTYDTADRITTPGTGYDALGRTSTAPAANVSGGADLSLGYYANDLAHTQTQNGRTLTYSIDPADRLHSRTDSATGQTQIDHYTGGDDSPDWTTSGTSTTRYTTGLDGNLAAQTLDGTVALQLVNLHGDVIATADPAGTGTSSYTETDEYGNPRSTPAGDPARYGWLGGKQRAQDDLAGLTLMGVRQYNPATGRFLTVDPIPGGSANNYDYCSQDPVNNTDLSGDMLDGVSRSGRGIYHPRHRHHWWQSIRNSLSHVTYDYNACLAYCVGVGFQGGNIYGHRGGWGLRAEGDGFGYSSARFNETRSTYHETCAGWRAMACYTQGRRKHGRGFYRAVSFGQGYGFSNGRVHYYTWLHHGRG